MIPLCGMTRNASFQVLERETYALKNALVRACDERIPVTVIVCQKRHHTRFFPTNMKASDRPAFQNIPPGTVVDTGPVSPTFFDFYLCSHAGIQVRTALNDLCPVYDCLTYF